MEAEVGTSGRLRVKRKKKEKKRDKKSGTGRWGLGTQTLSLI